MDASGGQAFIEYLVFGLLGYEKYQISTATANIDHTKTELVTNSWSN